MAVAYIALGSNLKQRKNNIKRAVQALSLLPQTDVLKVSGLYETDPVGFTKQGRFINAAVKVKTDLSPQALLGGCLGIEAGMGRIRTIKNGPRIIDLDLLLYDEVTLNTPELTLPHPEMMNRAFVLRPLTDLTDDSRYSAALMALENQ